MLQYLKKKQKTNKFVKIERGEESTPHCMYRLVNAYNKRMHR